jgi:ribose transport system permease protein
MTDWRFHLAQQRGTLTALAIFIAMFAFYVANHPAGFTANVVQTVANKGVLLALVAMAQTLVVLTSGIDLSVGMIFILSNCVASYVVSGSALATTFGIAGVIALGALCGAINAMIVIFGRLQPIVTTIATGAVYFGIALWIRPFPGSSPEFNSDIADALTGKISDLVPTSLVVLLGIVLLVWLPFQGSVIGRAVYAVGSSEQAAYMSGMPIRRAKFAAYVLGGMLAACGGLFLTFFTYSGEASLANGNTYTLYSIAAVVLGGVSLFGGRGSAIGAIFGALAFRAIGDLLFVFDVEPLWQPLFQGLVLLLAVSIGSARLFQVRNRLELFT